MEGESIESPSFKVTNIWILEKIFMDVIVCDAWASGIVNILDGVAIQGVELWNCGMVAIVKIMRSKSEWGNGSHMNECWVVRKGRASGFDGNSERRCDHKILIKSSYKCRSVWRWQRWSCNMKRILSGFNGSDCLMFFSVIEYLQTTCCYGASYHSSTQFSKLVCRVMQLMMDDIRTSLPQCAFVSHLWIKPGLV